MKVYFTTFGCKVNQYETVYNIFYDAFKDFVNNSNVHVSGKAKIFEQPEYKQNYQNNQKRNT